MKLSLSNVGILPDIDIDVDGLTVVTGANGTGKSTLLKAIRCALQPSQASVEATIRSEFGSLGQFVNARRGGHADIVVDGVRHCEVSSGGVSLDGHTDRLPRVLYFDPSLPVGLVPERQACESGSGVPVLDSGVSRKRFDSVVGSVLEAVQVDFRSMSSGERVFAGLRDLADSGRLDAGCLLLMDQPDAYLHPIWVNRLAEAVSAMVSDMGVPTVLTTHSAQLLMALEGEVCDGALSARFLNLSRGQDGVELSSPLADLQGVYADMAGPLVQVSSRFLDRGENVEQKAMGLRGGVDRPREVHWTAFSTWE